MNGSCRHEQRSGMNFSRLCTGIDVQPLIDTLAAHSELWDQFTARQESPAARTTTPAASSH
jgi:hypothetical protein